MNGFKARVGGCVIATAIASILLTVSPVGTSTVALAQSQISVSVEFRTALEPYGRWERHSRWGDVWIPNERRRAWRPYTEGRWVYTEEWGWYWVEDRAEADWGWATYHYGRWVLDREMGWVWLPGQEWGPGFVQWRHGRQHVGWAPLPPDEIADEYRDEPRVWVFVEVRDFTAPRYTRVILSDPDQDIYFRETVVINQTVVLRDRRIAVNPGIPPAYIAASVGRPIRAYEVRPRVLPGTVQIKGAIEVRPGDVRGTKGGVPQVAVRETQTVIRPNDRISPPQPLAAGERGRLGDNPPKAAQGQQPGGVQDPNQQQKQGQGKEKQLLPKQGQGTEQPKQQGIEKQPQPKQQGKDSERPRQQGTERRDEKQPLPKQGQGSEQPKQQGIEKQPQPKQQGKESERPRQQGTERRDEKQPLPKQGQGTEQPRQQGIEKQPQPKQQGKDSERPRQQGTERRDEKQPRLKQGQEGEPKQ
jgi:hypothetical protein